MKLLETVQSTSLQDAFQRVEKEMRSEGVCLVLRFLEILNDCPVQTLEELQSKNVNELRELSKQLPKEVAEFAKGLIDMMNPKKKKEVSKPKEEVEEEGKKGGKKGKAKGGKKGKTAVEEEPVESEKVEEYIDVFVKVTDFGGPLFKPVDRWRLVDGLIM